MNEMPVIVYCGTNINEVELLRKTFGVRQVETVEEAASLLAEDFYQLCVVNLSRRKLKHQGKALKKLFRVGIKKPVLLLNAKNVRDIPEYIYSTPNTLSSRELHRQIYILA